MSMLFPTGAKSEWTAQARAIAFGEIETSASHIPELLEWLRDINWPGAPEIAGHLCSFGDELIAPLKIVLRANDDIWTHWVLASFSDKFGRQFWEPLRDDLRRVAENEKDDEGANLEALFILATTKLEGTSWIQEKLGKIKQRNFFDPDDYEKIEAALGE